MCPVCTFAQEKVTKEKGTRVARRAKNARCPVLLAPPGRCATRHALYGAWLRQCSRRPPGGAAVLGELERDFKIYIRYIYIKKIYFQHIYFPRLNIDHPTQVSPSPYGIQQPRLR